MLKAKAIPYKSFEERIRITKQEQKKKRRVTFDSENVYSFPIETKKSKYIKTREFKDGKSSRTFKNFKCNSCSTVFRITALTDIQWSICPMCGGANIDFLGNREEKAFENKIS